MDVDISTMCLNVDITWKANGKVGDWAIGRGIGKTKAVSAQPELPSRRIAKLPSLGVLGIKGLGA